MMHFMIFPEFFNARFLEVNLNTEAIRWLEQQQDLSEVINPLLDPVFCQRMTDELREQNSVDVLYGGWLEDRSTLWQGSYLQEKGTFLHLGVDLTVPIGTRVAVDEELEAVRIETDHPEEGGWGYRVIFKRVQGLEYILYAHLGPDIQVRVGDVVKAGQVFATVGDPGSNGGWFPHLHIQVIEGVYFEDLLKRDALLELDGYGAVEDEKTIKERFRNPFEFVRL